MSEEAGEFQNSWLKFEYHVNVLDKTLDRSLAVSTFTNFSHS